MLPFQVYVKYVDRIVDMDIIEPGDCSVISLINDTRKILSVSGIETWESWQLRVTFPWNGQQHVLARDDELLLCFQLFESRNLSSVEFELILVSNGIYFPEDEPVGLLGFNEEANVEPDEANNEEGITE
ncbi:hypothetical protein Ddye_017121 [Dipteronia dyeriana]|uniref:Uncharacterized protein n=1 Tax=Dipteronia dyeriana TaxID=168575 RepID=A0AAD9U8Y0_9ROSI|nr:hypothetical protein Ddye_017121 [Dipteronia dyeriana]